jgi:hypothetical protein
MRVQDLYGVTKMVVGQLDPNGSPSDTDNYGMAVVNAVGEMVKLSQLAFGVKYDVETGSLTTSSTTYIASTGPSVDIVVGSTKRFIVMVSAQIDVGDPRTAGPGGQFALMSFSVLNLDTNDEEEDGQDGRAAYLTAYQTSGGDHTHVEATVSAMSLWETNESGNYRVAAAYRSLSGNVRFSQRQILVIPY